MKTKKILVGLLAAVAGFGLVSCGDDSNDNNQQVEDQKFTVTFNTNGGSSVTSQDIITGQKATKPTDPTRTGYTFKGWYKDSGLTTEFNFDTEVITAATTIYAKWEADVVVYTITFNTNGGSTVADAKVDSGNKVTKPSDPTKSGNEFGGWFTDATCKNEYDFNSTVTSGFTLYAKWVSTARTVIFNTNGGSDVETATVNQGEKVTKPSDPTKDDHAFDGWYTDAELTTEFNFDTPITSHINLYAKWSYDFASKVTGEVVYSNTFEAAQEIGNTAVENGIYYTVSGTAKGDGVNNVLVENGKLFVQDTDTGATTSAIVTRTISAGVLSIYAEVSPAVVGTKWTFLQVYGSDDKEFFGVRTDGGTTIGVRANGSGDADVTNGVAYGATDVIAVSITYSTLTGEVQYQLINKTKNITGTAGTIATNGSGFGSLRFVTSSAARSLYVDNVAFGFTAAGISDIQAVYEALLNTAKETYLEENYSAANYLAIQEIFSTALTNLTLTTTEEEIITLYNETLAAAKLVFTQAEDDAVANIETLIAAIGEVTKDSGEAITAARAAYDAASDRVKGAVTTLEVLVAAEEAYENVEHLNVIALIEAIGTVNENSGDAIDAARAAYNALSEEKQLLVTNFADLEAAETAFANIEVTKINNMITALGAIEQASNREDLETLLVDYEAVVALYGTLTEDQQLEVVGYDGVLTTITLLEAAILPYEIEDEIALIVIEDINSSNAGEIIALYNKYETLTTEQKAVISTENQTLIENAYTTASGILASIISVTTEGFGEVAKSATYYTAELLTAGVNSSQKATATAWIPTTQAEDGTVFTNALLPSGNGIGYVFTTGNTAIEITVYYTFGDSGSNSATVSSKAGALTVNGVSVEADEAKYNNVAYAYTFTIEANSTVTLSCSQSRRTILFGFKYSA